MQVISREEFTRGCQALNASMGPGEALLEDIDHMLSLMDFDHSDSIDINEFYETFRILDSKDGKMDGVISIAGNKSTRTSSKGAGMSPKGGSSKKGTG